MQNEKIIPIFSPSYDDREVDAISRVLKSKWSGLGPETEKFEQAFAEKLGVKHAIAVNSCTAALHLAYLLHGVGPGDEVIVPGITFISTAHCVLHAGGTPIFADVEKDTLLMDTKDVYQKITPRTKLIVPVLYAGQSREYTSKLPVVYDCAHAAGSKFNARGKTCCWSFHAVKNISCGDGGMLTTDDDNFACECRKLRWLGIDKSTWDRTEINKKYWWEYFVNKIGYKYHMNDISAAIGIVQLNKLDQMQEKRKKIVTQYLKELNGYVGLPPFQEESSWHLFVIRSKHRNELAIHLKKSGICTGVHYKPINLYKCYKQTCCLPVSEEVWKEILTLPLYPDLTEDMVSFICSKIKNFYKEDQSCRE